MGSSLAGEGEVRGDLGGWGLARGWSVYDALGSSRSWLVHWVAVTCLGWGMAKIITFGILIGVVGGIASALVLTWMGIELTPAVIGGAVGGSVGAVVAGSLAKREKSSE